jgi:hypothetical protein
MFLPFFYKTMTTAKEAEFSIGVVKALFLLALMTSLAAVASRAGEFVGTTPCGAAVRDFLGIPRQSVCDKITWRISLETNSYKLIATFGLQEQSAPGFVSSGTNVQSSGKVEGPIDAGQFKITDDLSGKSISLKNVTENHLQFIDANSRLMTGNEFWSYTLNRKGAGRER